MEGGSLFTSGFLGVNLIGGSVRLPMMQPGVITLRVESMEIGGQIPGQSRRYKVRIIGYHDKQEESIPSDQLPKPGHVSCYRRWWSKQQHIKQLL